jgi:hypothetical protein
VVAIVIAAFNRRSLMLCALAGLVLAIMFGEGGVYQATQAGMLAALIAIYLALARRSLWPLGAMMVVALFALGFAAVKLLPGWQLMRAGGQLFAGGLPPLCLPARRRHQRCHQPACPGDVDKRSPPRLALKSARRLDKLRSTVGAAGCGAGSRGALLTDRCLVSSRNRGGRGKTICPSVRTRCLPALGLSIAAGWSPPHMPPS